MSEPRTAGMSVGKRGFLSYEMTKFLTPRQKRKKIKLMFSQLKRLYKKQGKQNDHTTEITFDVIKNKFHVIINGARNRGSSHKIEFYLKLDDKPKTLNQLFYIGKSPINLDLSENGIPQEEFVTNLEEMT
jgi:hypothetical protein